MAETTTCPYCAEDILVAAIKCKHCGEFLDKPSNAPAEDRLDLDDDPPIGPVWRFAGIVWRCIAHDQPMMCVACNAVIEVPKKPGKKGDLYPQPNAVSPSGQSPQMIEAVWKYSGWLWKCVIHDRAMCLDCNAVMPKPSRPGKRGELFPFPRDASLPAPKREVAGRKISEVGNKTANGLACPHCGGTNFKDKRSRGSKLLTVPTVGVGALLVPKHRVKCVTCGTEFVRG